MIRDIAVVFCGDCNGFIKMILCKKDPIVEVFRKFDQPMYLMEENPTAENIARHIFYQARNQKLNVSEVRVWETSTSCAAFSEN